MGLETVKVPEGMEALFSSAEEVVSSYFEERLHKPSQGTIDIQGERYVLVRGASLSVEFFAVVAELFGKDREAEGRQFALNILFDLAHAVGRSDARNFHARMGLEDPIARLSAGPVHFAHTGWASVDIAAESNPTPDDDFFLLYDHPFSFESDAWLRDGRSVDVPVCIMNAGYSSGWCEESFGVQLVASEVLCVARGDHTCRFVMAPPSRIEERLSGYIESQPSLAGVMRDHQIPDLFARKRLEDELRRSRDELEQRVTERTEELRRTNERLREEMAQRQQIEQRLRRTHRLEALGELAGGIAHDFNNLLTTIRGYADLVAGGTAPPEKVAEWMGQITAAAERASRLTGQLLVFGRHEQRTAEILDLSLLARQMGEMLGRLLGEDVQLTEQTEASPTPVRLDPGHAEQIIMNLLVNARDAMPRGGTLQLRVQRETLEEKRAQTLGTSAGDKVVLTVADSGVGIEQAILERIFDPFFTTKPVGQGTGLGLATVYGITERCGAAIDVQSSLGEGTTFSIWFDEAPGTVTAQPKTARRDTALAAMTILVVEDEPALHGLVKELLLAMGHTPQIATGPSQAQAIFKVDPERFDLVLSDVIMPEMSGPELVVALRRVRPDVPVLFMSGYTDEALGRYGIDRDRERLLTKPFTAAQLREHLEPFTP